MLHGCGDIVWFLRPESVSGSCASMAQWRMRTSNRAGARKIDERKRLWVCKRVDQDVMGRDVPMDMVGLGVQQVQQRHKPR